MSAVKASTRHKARTIALQALYQWSMTGAPIQEIQEQFLSRQNPKKVDVSYFQDLTNGVLTEKDRIDHTLIQHMPEGSQLSDLDPIELCILRVSVYELLFKPDVPYRVVINEALEIEKEFGATEGHRYVNGVLDRLAHEVRKDEINKE